MAYITPTQPMAHQVEALRRVRARPLKPSPEDVFSYEMETGTGKTKPILDEFQERVEKDLDNLFVLAPAGSYLNWYYDREITVAGQAVMVPSELRLNLDPALLSKLAVAVWEPGAKAKRQRAAVLLARGRPRALFMNIESLSSGKDAYAYAVSFLRTGRTMFVIDESTRIRNVESRRTKRVIDLANLAPTRRIMSGLIAPKDPLDLFWQYWFLDWRILGFTSYTAFKARYAVVDRLSFVPNVVLQNKLRPHYHGPKLILKMTREELLFELKARKIYVQMVEKIRDFQNLDELQAKIAPYRYRVLKSECLDLPPKSYEIVNVPLTDEQARIYKDIKEKSTAWIEADAHVTPATIVAQMVRLHQVACGHVVDELGAYHDIPSSRIDALVDLLREKEGRGKAVVWTTYRPELLKIVARLEQEFGQVSTAKFWGGNRNTRVHDEASFLADPRCWIMVATQGAGGVGNNWMIANLVIYHANNHDLEMRFQSEDRTHRKGQEQPVTYVDLVAPNTVDERILICLRKKINLFTMVSAETYKQWVI